uniref:Uncharacterized protein n=2 Tax=Aegilops tauschii subsp. strangulata TaxID=200361 RepID=A0A453N1U2_AEGTS
MLVLSLDASPNVFKMAWTAAKSSGQGLFQLCHKSNTHTLACLTRQGAYLRHHTAAGRPGIYLVIRMMPCPDGYPDDVGGFLAAGQGGEGVRRDRRPWLGLLRPTHLRAPGERHRRCRQAAEEAVPTGDAGGRRSGWLRRRWPEQADGPRRIGADCGGARRRRRRAP